jgi:hypothetical protein
MPRLSVIGQSLASRITEIRPKFRQAAFDEPALRRLCGQFERAFVCGDRFLCAPQAAANVGSCRVRQVVVRELAAGEDRVDEREADFGAITHGDGSRAIEFHNGRRLDAQKYIIESNNLAPIGSGGDGRLGGSVKRHAEIGNPRATPPTVHTAFFASCSGSPF